MKKWEYRIEGLSAKDFNDEKSIKEIKDLLSRIGSEGWELMGVVPTSQLENPGLTGKTLIAKKCLLIFKKGTECLTV